MVRPSSRACGTMPRSTSPAPPSPRTPPATSVDAATRESSPELQGLLIRTCSALSLDTTAPSTSINPSSLRTGSVTSLATTIQDASPQSQSPKTPVATSPSTVHNGSSLPSSDVLLPTPWIDNVQHSPNNAPDEDGDSTLGSELDELSSTASLTSSIMNYRVLHGRTYHAQRGDSVYWAANDDRQNEALDMIHHMSTMTINGKLFLAPIQPLAVSRALDVGTGTGIWAVDFADEFPGTEVVGTDISPIQPSWVPPNLKFEMEDFTKDWTFAPDSFDYVHMRYLYGSVADWFELFRQAFRVTKPGGWVESYEASPLCQSDDGTVKEGSALAEWGTFFIEGGKKMGRVFTPLPNHLQEKAMEAAGFVDVQVSTMKVPIGDWPRDSKLKEIGRFVHLSLEADLEGYVMFMADLLGTWTKEAVLVYCAQLRKEVRSRRHHAYYFQRIVWARKPE